ncbi:GNAT family N-acetyltransferase [Streptomyces sp. 110]|uniref:GNAT family N-acetyltransferase n=1 Tax=Streptomyces endocoffeicus TaxID=2898945 RepID=A0ABS1Q1W7_9ACTN|nr:GNAT family N-acetyltransferase [Streptomyces endocoffeicus]MBL1118663.1 GNAT family N-acetyltransferase [Streptomyces endocoffeicus]
MTTPYAPAQLPHTVRAADTPGELPTWQRLAADASLYCGTDWLEFSDTDHIARARYFTAHTPTGDPSAGLIAHWSPQENNERYVPERVLPTPLADKALIIGGRRGYLSGPLLAPGLSVAGQGDALDTLLEAATAWCPQAEGRWWWPYLTTDSATTVRAALTAAGRGPVAAQLLSADCVIAVPEGGLDAHIAALPTKQRRTNARRELRAFAESGLCIVRTTLAGHADALGPLLANVQQRYGHDHSAEQMTSLLRRQAEHLQDASVVFLCLAPGDNRPVGFCLAYRHGRELAVRLVGFDYDRLPGAAEYAHLAVYEPVRYCQENGLERVELGMESFEAKCRRGAAVRPLWALHPVGGAPDPEAQAARRDTVAAALPAREGARFRAETDKAFA